jgi:hypothetical protein
MDLGAFSMHQRESIAAIYLINLLIDLLLNLNLL